MDNIYSSDVVYDIIKNTTKNCLETYDSYFLTMYNSHTSSGRSDYYLYCGNVKDRGEGDYYFDGYELYHYYFNGNSTSTFDINYSHSVDAGVYSLKNNANSTHKALNLSNVSGLGLSDFVYSEKIVVENNSNSSNSVNLPFNREEFIVIPFLLCILILMIFLRWCFPMKGGKSI